MLRVVHISTADGGGGSARSAYRIHNGLRNAGIDSKMLVGFKGTNDTDVEVLAGDHRKQFLNRAMGAVGDALGLQFLTYPAALAAISGRLVQDADVIQLYNLHGYYFNPLALARLDRSKPVVWRLSDMWPLTGHCAYSYECERWKIGCGQCPDLRTEIPIPYDTTRWLWEIKKRLYARLNLTIVAPSRWMEAQVRQSPLLKGCHIAYIPNGVDEKTFRPIDKAQARELLGLPHHVPIIMFSAASVTDPRKGAIYLCKALRRLLSQGCKPFVLLVGRGNVALEVPHRSMGHVQDDLVMALCYSAADAYVLPTVAENLPNTIVESLACGTPVVSFDTGGVAEAVRHMETGYLSRTCDAEDLAYGIELLIARNDFCRSLSSEAVRFARGELNDGKERMAFLNLYEALVSRRSASPVMDRHDGRDRETASF